MKLKTFLCLFAAAIPVLAHAVPLDWRPVDAKTLDVAGVKLGMNHEQALAALVENFNLSTVQAENLKKSISFEKDTSNATAIRFRNNDGVKVEVRFEAQSPTSQTKSMVVTYVNYSTPHTTKDHSMLKETAFAKYGEPSKKNSRMWCTNYHSTRTCDPGKPSLQLHQGQLILQDPTYRNSRKEHGKQLRDSQVKKPKI